MRMVLGIDGGASKTNALMLNEKGQAVGFGSAGGGNHQVRGLAPAVVEIKKAVRGALGDYPPPVDIACFCLSGADLEEDFIMLQSAMEKLNVAGSVVVKNDTLAAMRAGLTRSWGIVVICGSGFNAAARSPNGHEIVLPGLGPISGDWGGGGALSTEMIRLVMRAWDGRGKPTRLTEVVLNALNVPTVDVLLHKLYHDEIPHQKILALVPLLFETAEEGDEVARELVMMMGVETGITARSLIRRSGMEELNPEVVLGGSVYKGKGSLLLGTIKKDIHTYYPGVQVKKPCYEPVVGSALLALEAIGVIVDEPVMANLNESLPEHLKIKPEISKAVLEVDE
ncbi:MAG: BadF/BadG/BcrA/BcrD ATPase family protein [Bellilinea sp.]